MASVAFTTKKAIYDGLTSALTDCDVSYGFKRDPGSRWVMVSRVIWDNTDWVTFPVQAGRARREEFTVALIANVTIHGGNESDVDIAIEALSNEIEAFLRQNTTLNVTGVWSVEYAPEKAQAYPVTDGYECQLSANVKIKART